MNLIDELFANGVLSEERANALKKEIGKNGKTEERVLLDNKVISEEALFQLKSKLSRIPLKTIKPESVPQDVLELIPEEASSNYKMVAFSKTENFVQIGMVYPENILAQNALRFLPNQGKFTYHIYLLTISNFNILSQKRKTIGLAAKKALDELEQEKDQLLDNFSKTQPSQIVADDAPVVKMVQIILRHAVETKSSDIHIEPGREKINVRFRKDGILKSGLSLPLKIHVSIAARIKILAGLRIDETRVPQDGRFSLRIGETDIDFRVATFPSLYGEKVELRVLDTSMGSKKFEELGLSGRNLEVIKSAMTKPHGMILFTGPTGSGKTTTQYAILRQLNQESVNIVTVEDPIEYSIGGVNQSQVKPEIGYTFAAGLRQILRQDPNIIMVGEIRDEETAELAVNAALTGHIVLSTLHTNSSVGVVPRLIDMGVKPFLIPSVLRVVIGQRLIRVLCQKCKVKVRPNEKVRNYIMSKIKNITPTAKKDIAIPENVYVFEAKGCKECNSTGYAGREGVYEVLSMSDELAELILKNPLESFIVKAARKQGMVFIEEASVMKILEGKTTVEEAIRVSGET